MPTPEEDLRIWTAQEALRLRTETTYRNRIRREKNRYVKAVIETYRLTGKVERDQEWTDHKSAMAEATRLMAGLMIKRQGSWLVRYFEDNVNKEVNLDFYDWLEREWMRLYGLQESTAMSLTTFEDVRAALITGQTNNETTAEIVRRIRAVTSLNTWRSRAIARTETHNAASYASKKTAEELQKDSGENVYKFWIPVQDLRTRDAHLAMDSGNGIGLQETFNVGGSRMDRPGDPLGGPENVINCRCQLIYSRNKKR